MTGELLAALGIIAGATISGIAAVYAVKAEKNSRPTSNGFSAELRADIRELRQLMVDHLADHSRD